VLLQLGLLEADGLPIAGAASAHKVRDVGLPSNTLIP
jgi:carboxymethylenebutenolidase